MANTNSFVDGQKRLDQSNKRGSRRIYVNLEAELSVGGQTYPVLIGNLSETGFHIILPIPPGASASLDGMSDVDLKIRVSSAEVLNLSCKKLWSTEIPESPLVRRVGLLIINPSDAYKKFYKSHSYRERTEVTRQPVAVIGLACYYPGAPNVQMLWENILARRRQFRRMPDVRLPLKDYYDPDPTAIDKTYGTKAAVIDGFAFDWIKRGIPKSVVDSADISHWLALETAIRALDDAGYNKTKVPPDRSGVILGNTLTGEQTRAEGMRLRWPFVEKTLRAAAGDSGLPSELMAALATNMEAYYKSVFAPVTEDTLAGGMSNTIAGRICNFLNLNGGGYTVDGACSSSLIAVATAATALSHGSMDLAIVGGVDVSLDTFELIGFAKTRALTKDDMRVYDRRANGFIPGEGSGFAVLKRLEDARADGDYIYAVIRGWGMSTDGKGGLTAPKAETQALAIRRAYTGAGYALDAIDFVEGHGTGTPAGDKAELTAVAEVIGEGRNESLRPCGITSLKSIIGHTKAASGIGGFIKAVMATNRRVLPPTANCTEPNPIFENPARLVYPIMHGEIRPAREVLRAGVSGMGFGGINCHITLESGDAPSAKLAPTMEERKLLVSSQETELFIFGAPSPAQLLERVRAVRETAQGLSVGDMVDLAAQLSKEVEAQARVRAALIADSPESLIEGLQELENKLSQNPPVAGEKNISPRQNFFIGHSIEKSKVGFLFPGQGAQQLNMAQTLIERHEWARDFIAEASSRLKEESEIDVVAHMFKPLDRALDKNRIEQWAATLRETQIAQPAICLASVLWCKKLDRFGITPVAVGGHSLGELTAFHVAGAFAEATLLQLAAMRGQAMAAPSGERGTMASLACAYETAAAILKQVEGYVIAANINSPRQLVISGEREAVEQAVAIAQAQGIDSRMLQVSNAFHSKFVAGAAERLRSSAPVPMRFANPKMKLFSGIGGLEVKAGLNLRDHFADQVISQVDFVSIIHAMSRECDFIFEVGPGKALSGLTQATTGDKGPLCLPVESKPGRDRDLHLCLAHLFVQGGAIRWEALYEDRLVRPFVSAASRMFIVNPCEKPFAPSRDISPKTFSGESGALQSALAATTDIDPQVLSDYLVKRGPFLSAMIKADIENLSLLLQSQKTMAKSALPVKQAPPSSDGQGETIKIEKNPNNDGTSITDLLLELIEKRTGFPRESLSAEMRLLDDLNLDSIKSAELLAEATMRLGVAGLLDTAQYANAPISEVVDALHHLTATQQKEASPPVKQETTTEILFKLIEKRTGFPVESLSAEMRLLDDLNLDSIKSAELLAEAATLLGVAGDIDASQHANKTVAEIAAALDQFVRAKEKPATEKPKASIMGASPVWVRNFVVTYAEEELLSESIEGVRKWQGEKVLILSLLGETDLAESLREHFDGQGALSEVLWYEKALQAKQLPDKDYSTIISILPRLTEEIDISQEGLLFSVEQLRLVATFACKASKGKSKKVAFVQFGGGYFGRGPKNGAIVQCPAMAFAASLHLERPDLKVRVLDFDPRVNAARIAAKVTAELSTEDHYGASGYDIALTRRVPRLTLQEPADYKTRDIAWSSADVILVTGGAKGITAACSLELARQTKVRMALVGSSPHPDSRQAGRDSNNEISQTLSRFREAGLTANYYQCDIVDPAGVNRLVSQVQQDLGRITGVIHGSAQNKPRDVEKVFAAEALAEISPKLLGAVNVLQALQKNSLKLVIGFSSIIGISGMERNAWYGFSNEALDLLLRRFAEENPSTAVLSIAFSIWDEIGMGVQRGSIKYLAQKGIAAIPVQEGVRRFLQLVMHDPGERHVVIAARIAALDTLQSMPHPLPKVSRFLEKILSYSPDIEVITRSHLSVEKDPYVLDHNWRGTLLFPTVFGLEAMAQNVAYVTGESNFDSIRIEDIRLERPIPVNPEKGVEIEIRAEVLERQLGDIGRRVRISIGTEQTGFSAPHFFAIFVLGEEERQTPVEKIALPERPLDIDPKEDLYNGRLLFQGARFQRLIEIYSLDSKKCVFQSRPADFQQNRNEKSDEEIGQSWLLGDPYLRDSLLHVVQLSVSQDICLPFIITSIERLMAFSDANVSLTGIARIEGRTDKEVHAVVMVLNDKGLTVERINGFVLKILEYHEEYPTPEDLADPGSRDESIIRRQLQKIAERWGLEVPEIAVAHLPFLPGRTKEERHKLELPLFQRAVRTLQKDSRNSGQEVAVSWLPSGKPRLENTLDEGWDISLSHDHATVFCVAGFGPQGCDLESISTRTREEWIALLGKDKGPLLEELQASGDSLALAGTRIWAGKEAFYKATGSRNGDYKIKERDGKVVVFQINDADSNENLLSFPVALTRGPERVEAMIVRPVKKQEASYSNSPTNLHAEKLNFDLRSYKVDIADGPHKQPAFTFSFPVTFKEAANPSRTLYFSNYFDWIGKLREYIIHPIYQELVKWYTTGKWGSVTNHAETEIIGEARSGDIIQGRVWLDKISGKEQSTLEFCFEWRKILPGGGSDLIAVGKTATTWVAVRGHGIVEIQPLPEFGRDFFSKLLPSSPRESTPPNTFEPIKNVDFGKKLYQEYVGPLKSSSLLREESIQTSLEDANLVGNIYFANYYKWQGRTRDNFLKEIAPEYFIDAEKGGELRCVHCKVNHMNEAMPFDRIVVRMHRKAVYECGVEFYFDYYRLNADGDLQKLGYGEHKAKWYAPNNVGGWKPAELPSNLLDALIPKEKQVSTIPLIQNKKDHKYDVIVIGAGIGGLTAGALLANRGKKVLVLEQHTKPGGFCTCWERYVINNNQKLRFVFEAGVHDIATFGQYSNTLKILKELRLDNQIEWRRVDHEYFIQGLRIKVPRSLKEYVQVLSDHFPQEQEGLVAFFQEVEISFKEIYSRQMGKRSGRTLSIDKWKNVPFETMLDNYINNQQLKKLLSILAYYITDKPEALNALIAIPYFGYYMEGGSYPVGGTQALSDSLAASIKKNDGEVGLQTPVTGILIENGQVKGVTSKKGEIFLAETVVSNADVRRTFLELVKREHLPSHFVTRIEKIRPSNSAYIVSLGVDFIPDVNPATFVFENNEGIALMIPSKVDPSLAPPGYACVTLIKLVSYKEATTWNRNDPSYVRRKEQYGNELIRLAETAIPNLTEHIIYRQDGSPSTFARYAWTTGGCIYGPASDEWRPSIKTPIKGLYLAGANTAIRPGVEDAVFSGIAAADTIEEFLAITTRIDSPHLTSSTGYHD